MTPIEKPITNIIREAIINNLTRVGILNEIETELNVSRGKAKQLFYAFIYFADEEFLEKKLFEQPEVIG